MSKKIFLCKIESSGTWFLKKNGNWSDSITEARNFKTKKEAFGMHIPNAGVMTITFK